MVVRLKGKIFGGFGLVGLLILISGISSFTLVGDIGSQTATFRRAVDRADAMRQLDLVMQKVQASVHLWQQDADPAVAREVDAEITDARSKVADSKARAASPEQQQTAAEIEHGLDAYVDGWHLVQQLAADRAKTYVEQIDARSEPLRNTLARLRVGQAESGNSATAMDLANALDAYMTGQLAVMRYRATGDGASVAQAEEALAQAASLADKTLPTIHDPKDQAALKQAKAEILAYRVAFEHIVQMTDARVGRLTAWSKEGETIAVGTTKLRQEAERQEDAVQQSLLSKATSGSSSALMSVVAIFLLAMILSFVLTRSISQPIVRMTHAMKRLASGDKTVEIPDVTRQDEIGEMAQAVEVFKENALQNERLQAEAEENRKREAEAVERRRVEEEERRRQREAETDQRRMEQEARSARMFDLTQSFDRDVTGALKEVSTAAERMEQTASALATTAEETNRETAAVSSAAAQATGSVETVAAAAEELSVSIDEISRQVAELRRIAEEAVASAGRTNATVRGLAEAAQRIGAVVELINTIAGQTNLLALNATIEAARAGEMGKGFAVVASEVKALANQTAKATDEIAAQIAGMQQVTGEAVSGIAGISTIIEQINSIASNIAAAVDEQAVSTREIARSVQEAAAGTSGVSANIEAVNQAAGDTGSGAMAVLDAARALTRQSELLRSQVDRFLTAIKVA